MKKLIENWFLVLSLIFNLGLAPGIYASQPDSNSHVERSERGVGGIVGGIFRGIGNFISNAVRGISNFFKNAFARKGESSNNGNDDDVGNGSGDNNDPPELVSENPENLETSEDLENEEKEDLVVTPPVIEDEDDLPEAAPTYEEVLRTFGALVPDTRGLNACEENHSSGSVTILQCFLEEEGRATTQCRSDYRSLLTDAYQLLISSADRQRISRETSPIDCIRIVQRAHTEKRIQTTYTWLESRRELRRIPGELLESSRDGFHGSIQDDEREFVAEYFNFGINMFSLTNKGSTRVIPLTPELERGLEGYDRQRAHKFYFHRHDPRGVYWLVSEINITPGNNRYSHNQMATQIYVFPRLQIPQLNLLNGRKIVTLTNGERVEFDEDNEIVSGVFYEGTIDLNPNRFNRKKPQMDYSGDGLVVKVEGRYTDARLEDSHAEVIFNEYDRSCQIPTREIWPSPGEDLVHFNQLSDLEFYEFVETQCSWDLSTLKSQIR